jgi:hypothetical protein
LVRSTKYVLGNVVVFVAADTAGAVDVAVEFATAFFWMLEKTGRRKIGVSSWPCIMQGHVVGFLSSFIVALDVGSWLCLLIMVFLLEVCLSRKAMVPLPSPCALD